MVIGHLSSTSQHL